MKVKTISYSKIFPLASYLNEKISIEVELDEKDDFDETFEYAKELVNKWGTKPLDFGLTGGETIEWPTRSLNENQWFTRNTTPMQAAVAAEINLAAQQTEIAIDNATSIEQLDLLMGDAAKYGLARELNEKKRKLLNNE
jgi:hypothetical protein